MNAPKRRLASGQYIKSSTASPAIEFQRWAIATLEGRIDPRQQRGGSE